MDLSDIAAVIGPSGLVSEGELLQLFSYISVQDDAIRETMSAPPFPIEHRTGGKRLKFASINDTNGLLYFIGTRGGKVPYTNPCTTGEAIARVSTTGGSPAECVADRNPLGSSVENAYGSDMSPWISVQFNRYLLRPTEYVVCQDQDHFIQNWRFEGREKGKTDWVVIQEYKNDKTITDNRQAVFKVSTGKFFQEFRISLTGPSHKGQTNFDITQLEFYGFYREITP